MFEEFYGLREKPFAVQPDPGFLFLSEKHKLALSRLRYSIVNRAGFTVITGDIGSGKTTLVRELMRGLEDDISVGLVSNVNVSSFTDLMQWILYSFELDFNGKENVELFEVFADFVVQNYSENRRTVLIIDEAQNLDTGSLEQLRMLLNINVDQHQVLQLILVGQAELSTTLRRPDLAQFAQRIEVDFVLQPLDMIETKLYIQHRLRVAGGSDDIFTPECYSLIWESTSGVPRLINILCGMAITYGFADFKDKIDEDVIYQVVKDKKGGFLPLESISRTANMDYSSSQVQKLHPNGLRSVSSNSHSSPKNAKNLSTIEKLFLQNKD